MSQPMQPRSPEEVYRPALEKAHQDFRGLDPYLAAIKSGAVYEPAPGRGGHFRLPFWGENYIISFPEGEIQKESTGEEPNIAVRILLLHYLITADGTPPAGQWVAFRELPGGLGYDAAFQGRANIRLARAFGQDPQGFIAAARALGGEKLSFGDVSYLFRIFPRLWLAVVLHLADEEFPAAAQVLFDRAAPHYLPTEDLAVLGGMLAGRLIKARP